MSLKELLTRIIDALKVDYPVEEGTSGIWTYRKWASGLSECWGKAENMTITSGAVTLPTFPTDLFLENTPEHASITPWYGASSSRTVRVYYVTATLGQLVYLRTYSTGVPTGTWACFAELKGRWK